MPFSFGTESCDRAFPNSSKPRVSSGLRFPEACAQHCGPGGDLGVSRCYIICSTSLSKNTDALSRLRSALSSSGTTHDGTEPTRGSDHGGGGQVAGVRIGISPHTPLAQVVEVIQDIRKSNHDNRSSSLGEGVETADVDCIITLGAGSLTDAAKLVRLGLANDVQPERDLGKLWGKPENNPNFTDSGKIESPEKIKLVHIPTSLSGGEYQALAGGTESLSPEYAGGGGNKRAFHCAGANPDLVILDPELCLTTPEWVWLSTGIRAVDHCVETLCCVLDVVNKDHDTNTGSSQDERDYVPAARSGLTALVKGLLECKHNSDSLTARRTCQDGVIYAMNAVSSGKVRMGASHAIGHQLGPLGVGHGETSCILLPAVCRYNLSHAGDVGEFVGKEIRERQASVRDLLVGIDEVQGILQGNGQNGGAIGKKDLKELELGDVLYAVIGALGMPQSLEAVKVGEDKFAELARQSLQDLWIKTNPVPVTQEDQVLEILGMCAKR